MNVNIIIFLICIKSVFTKNSDNDPTIITLPDGQIRGHVLKSVNNNEYYAFQEIPYAAPPVGDLRFRVPTAPQSWDDVLDTTKNTKICNQQGTTPLPLESEDCLYLNVYTPTVPKNNASIPLLPVLFYIHGGAFVNGTAAFDYMGPQFLIDYDIVIVTINYRLGPFGFLATEDGVIPGNIGLRDQAFALKWANKNIELFGGDPSQVTIVGVSAGAGSIGHLLLSKQTEGLYRGAILESGTSICKWAYQPNYNTIAFQMGEAIDPTFNMRNSTTELLKLLQSATASEINHAIKPSSLLDMPWTPITEDPDLEDPFVVGPMHDNIKYGEINQVPILIGFNSEEILSFVEVADNQEFELLGAVFDNVPTLMLSSFNMPNEDKEKAATELTKLYTNATFEDEFNAIVRYVSDDFFTTPIIRHADLQSNYTEVFLYEFAYKGALGLHLNNTIEGADTVGHGEEFYYFWCLAEKENCNLNNFPDSDILAQNRLLKLWTNFVKYLNPTPVEDELFEGIIWPNVTPNSIQYLIINETLDVKSDPKHYINWKSLIDPHLISPTIIY